MTIKPYTLGYNASEFEHRTSSKNEEERESVLQRREDHRIKMEPIKEKYMQFLDRYTQICTDVLQKTPIPFKIIKQKKVKNLTVAGIYTPYEVKKMFVFCLMVTSKTFYEKDQCMRMIDCIDDTVTKFNQEENIVSIDTDEMNTIKLIEEIKDFLKELTLDPEKSNIGFEFSTLIYKLNGDLI